VTTVLGSLCTFHSGGTPSKKVPRYFAGDIPWITGADIVGPVAKAARSFITAEAIRDSAANLVPAGTVLLVTRTSVGKVAIAGTALSFSQDITAISPDPKRLDSSYLIQFLRTRVGHFESMARGATIKGITRDVIAELPIPVPPIAKQRQIAAVLALAETLRATRIRTVSRLDTLTKAVFLEMFGDPITNPMRWPQRRISEIGRVITGNTPPRANAGNYGTAIEWIKSDNINTPYHYLTRAHEDLSEAGRTLARTVPAGSILVTCIAGSPDSIGNAAMTDREVAFNQQINAIVPLGGDVRFLYSQILVGKRLIQAASTGAMKGMVSKSRFEQVAMMYPPVALQREFARRFDAIENLQVAQRASLTELDALVATLQYRAFHGVL
jgi:type I restriction enzyme S subunit